MLRKPSFVFRCASCPAASSPVSHAAFTADRAVDAGALFRGPGTSLNHRGHHQPHGGQRPARLLGHIYLVHRQRRRNLPALAWDQRTNGVGSGNLGVYSQSQSTAASISVTATGLPTNGSTVYARLFADVNGNWTVSDKTYKAASGAPALSALSCTGSSFTGSATDTCIVALSSAAPSSGAQVTLASSNTAVTVPASVAVPAGNTSASFSAAISAVSSTQTGTLTAASGGVSKALSLTLNAATPALTLSAATLSFGNVSLNTPTTKTVSLESSGTASLTISGLALSGTGFSASGIATPLTLAPNQTATLTVQFDPTSAGAAAGQVSITTNASSGAAQTIALSGTGTSSTPTIISPAPGSALPGSSATFTWTTVSGVATYQLWLGTNAVGSGNIAVYSAAPSSASTISITATGLPTTGGTVYARLFTDINGNWLASDYTYTASSAAAALNALACATTSITGAASDVCSVSLTAPAPTGGFSVSLASSSSAVTVPASLAVAAGATTATFTATASAVTTAQAATISASASGISKAVALQLNPATAALTLSTASVSFGTVPLNTPSTQSVTLTSSGTANLTISALSLTGTGFTISGIAAPLTLAPGQSASLNVQFDPTTASSFTGALTISSNASSGASQTIALNGTGNSTTYDVNLTWNAPIDTSDTIAGYNIYRSAAGSSSYQLLNSSPNASTTFSDSNIQSAQIYTYIVTSVDASGVESLPSNSIDLSIP